MSAHVAHRDSAQVSVSRVLLCIRLHGYRSRGQHRFQPAPRVRFRKRCNLLRTTHPHHAPTAISALGTHVDHPVGEFDHVEIVFDEEQRVSLFE